MKLPLQVNFRNMEGSEAMKTNIEERAEKLNQFCDQIMSCRVMVEAQHRHRQAGNIYHVRIDITVPGKELVVSREPHAHHSHTDAYVAIRDAFTKLAAARQCLSAGCAMAIPYGRVSQLFKKEGYGRIETPDNRDIYFNRNSLVNGDFDKLKIGSEVSFAEEMGEHGPQASTVRLVGKHHYVEHVD